MKLYRKRDLRQPGIYCIKNLINNKIYVGKSIDIYTRVKQHCTLLNVKSKDENRHLINSWHKYGKDNFAYYVLEYLERDETLLKLKEYEWIIKLKSNDRHIGYNLRLDTSTKCIVTNETKVLMSVNRKKYHLDNPELALKVGQRFSNFWKTNPDKKKQMALAVKHTKQQKYCYFKLLEDGTLVKKYETVDEIISENSTYKWQNIYSVCNGYKKRMYGFKWKRELKEKIIKL